MNHPLLYNAFCEDDVVSGDRHITFDDKGVLCMTVVDPVTRKLLIPLNHVYPTRAQQRTTIPSLCQLFLNGRCRQGAQCHQVHASPDMVTVLRSQVETLPRCCALHGDRDYVGVMDDPIVGVACSCSCGGCGL
uniref:Uncharacterized protein TCIL3000_7_2010 n=1 Tax=Trypanosoma congolense (strain IL3000) TaxID=1068625 RepID=G0UPT0_TRYCI|nr:unnamed protein product [Trypanosoma congolense IL3000]